MVAVVACNDCNHETTAVSRELLKADLLGVCEKPTKRTWHKTYL
jgi:hypothetical protein